MSIQANKRTKKVNKQIKDNLDEEFEPSYQIHSTNYDTNFAFAEFWTPEVQTYPEKRRVEKNG